MSLFKLLLIINVRVSSPPLEAGTSSHCCNIYTFLNIYIIYMSVFLTLSRRSDSFSWRGYEYHIIFWHIVSSLIGTIFHGLCAWKISEIGNGTNVYDNYFLVTTFCENILVRMYNNMVFIKNYSTNKIKNKFLKINLY